MCCIVTWGHMNQTLSIRIPEKEIAINLCRDKDANKILALCKNNEIKYIITGDNDLLVLKKYESTKIIKPRFFWEIAKKQNT